MESKSENTSSEAAAEMAAATPDDWALPRTDAETAAVIAGQADEIQRLRRLVNHLSAKSAGLHAEVDAMRVAEEMDRQMSVASTGRDEASSLLDEIYGDIFQDFEESERSCSGIKTGEGRRAG